MAEEENARLRELLQTMEQTHLEAAKVLTWVAFLRIPDYSFMAAQAKNALSAIEAAREEVRKFHANEPSSKDEYIAFLLREIERIKEEK